MLAARPKTLTGAAVPVMLGCASAASAGSFDLLPAVLCLLFAFLMQIDANLINDLWDYLKGSDGKDRLGPERACAQGWITPRAMRRGIALTTAAACITGCGLLFYATANRTPAAANARSSSSWAHGPAAGFIWHWDSQPPCSVFHYFTTAA